MSVSQRREKITARRLVALLGIAAILFQALLFGWHHHALALGRSGPTASLSDASQPLAPVSAEDFCEICSILHHQSTAPLAFVTPAIPLLIASTIVPPVRVVLHQAAAPGFKARAPPAIESTT